MMTKTLATALTAAVLASQLAAPTASADERRYSGNPNDNVTTFTLKVPMDDLDPTTERGARALYRRILIAVERICFASLKKGIALTTTRQVEHAAQCFDNAVDAAVADARAIANVDIEELAGVDRYADVRLSAVR